MSRLNDLVRQLREREPALADDIAREVSALADRRAFGLNFERHTPEAVELPGRRVRRGDKVRVLPPRGTARTKADDRLWLVEAVAKADGMRTATVGALDGEETQTVDVDDLVVVAEFRDPIYPGLASTGRIDLGGDQPFHTVINAENYHALQTLLFTHRNRVDCIYIDPPYNTGARDWKYNNDYVEGDDLYRHSKWLAFIERRLILARELLNSEESTLIVTIDEKEVLRLGLLLEQVFPEADVQMISSVTNRAGSSRSGRFARVDEYIYFVFLGAGQIVPWVSNMLEERDDEQAASTMPTVWFTAVRRGTASSVRAARPALFYPVMIDSETGLLTRVGDPIPNTQDRTSYEPDPGTVAIWPLAKNGQEQTWRFSAARMREYLKRGTARLGKRDPSSGLRPITYLQPGTIANIENGTFIVTGRNSEGALELELAEGAQKSVAPRSVWNLTSHFARDHGSTLLGNVLGEKRFDFPKSLYAVEDTLRFVLRNKPDALILDCFAGSGTTAHAVMRLNRQDGGSRSSISVTNNEVSAEEQSELVSQKLRPGDPKWRARGIYEFVTRPRIDAAVTGLTPKRLPISGDYRFVDEFPMADGFNENVEFFDLTYEAPLRVASNREFERIAPLLWMRAGAQGRRIDDISKGWDVADRYGVIVDFDHAEAFQQALDENPAATHAFVVTDDDWLFQSVCRSLPERVEPVRLYEAYLRNFEFEAGGTTR